MAERQQVIAMTNNQENTSALKHPNKRVDFIAYLKEILVLKEESQSYDIDNIYHFFFDDTDLHPDAEAEVGWFLNDINEITLVNKLTFQLDELLKGKGDVITEKFTSDCKWNGIVEIAKEILDLIDKNEKGSEIV